MPIHIVSGYPAPGLVRRLASALVSLLGGVLILVGLLASIVPVIYIVVVVADLLTGKRVPAPEMQFVITTAVAAASLAAGLWLVRGKRRLVLFLRRFGFTGAT